jgi:type II secretion system protein I
MNKGNKPYIKTSGGFTLLEVLVALSIMGIAIILILQLFSSNLRALTVSGDMTSAIIQANARLREIVTERLLKEKSWREGAPGSYPMDIAVREILQERTDTLPVRLMEVALTVRWQAGSTEKSLTLRTMKMVDRMGPE